MDFTEFYRELQRIGCVEEEFPSRVAAVLYACFDAGLSVEQTRRFMSRFMLIKSVGSAWRAIASGRKRSSELSRLRALGS